MTPRTRSRPLDDPLMWRRLISRTHPDAGGDHELFIWTGVVKDAVCGGELQVKAKPEPTKYSSRRREGSAPRSSQAEDKPRVPWPEGTDFEEATRRALRVEGPYSSVLSLLGNCFPLPHLAHEESRGASYKRLAAIGNTHGMTAPQRSGWYRCAESIPLSDRHAGHILSRAKREAA